MHNEEYIASGILELYAAGGLTQAEREEVERRATASAEVRLALDEACAAMEAYAALHAVRPRQELKGKIIQQIIHTAEEAPRIPTADTPAYPLYPEETTQDSAFKWMFAASIVLLLVSGVISYHFYNKWQQAEERLAAVTASEQQLVHNYRNTSLQIQRQEAILAILRNPEFKLVRLKGVEAHPEASMLVYWNPRQQQVYIDQVSLPTPPSGRQYQLWALKNGQPIDAGMIATPEGEASLQQMKNIGAAQAFAVTLEPAGGSKTPTLDQLTVMGKIES